MKENISRRDILKLGALSLGSLAFNRKEHLPFEDRVQLEVLKTVRVAIRQDEIWTEPALNSKLVGVRKRDELVRVYDEFISPYGPDHNPRWYKVVGGYMHTAHLAPVETHLNPVKWDIDETGMVFEVTVPFAQTKRKTSTYGWENLYRLYYKSTHWVTGIEEGPDGEPWYRLLDDVLKIEYNAPAKYLRYVLPSEIEAIRPEVENKLIVVSLKDQTITCFEGDEVVLHTDVSTGIPSFGRTPNGIPTDTPTGTYNVMVKAPVRHMGDAKITSDIHAYELPGVPWSTFFTETGVAFHGTYWHDNYGGRMSHGCVNMRPEEAKWLFRWTTPEYGWAPGQWYQNGYGTRIKVV